MKKVPLLIMMLSFAVVLNARIVNSQNSGNATNPLTWDCLCIPVDGDTIMINHAVTLDVDYAFTMGGIHITSSGSLSGNSPARILGVSGGFLINDGSLDMGYLAHNGGIFTNNDTIYVSGSLLIDQAVTLFNNDLFMVNDSTFINTPSGLHNFGDFYPGILMNAGTVSNSAPGRISAGRLLNSGTVTHSSFFPFDISGSLFNTGTITFNGTAYVGGNLWQAEQFTTSAYLRVLGTIYNGDTISGSATFTNNGTISVYNSLYNSEDLTGTGVFCVFDSTVNSGNVTGTLDICDITAGAWDMNVGTVAGTVTYCIGPCTLGIPEEPKSEFSIIPNPASESCTINLNANAVATIEVYDLFGRLIISQRGTGVTKIDISALAPGMYSVRVSTADSMSEQKLIVQ